MIIVINMQVSGEDVFVQPAKEYPLDDTFVYNISKKVQDIFPATDKKDWEKLSETITSYLIEQLEKIDKQKELTNEEAN
jgi:hypothetical protein